MTETPCFVIIIKLENRNAFIDNDKACDNGMIFMSLISRLIPMIAEKRENVSYHMENHAGNLYLIFDKKAFSMGDLVVYKNTLEPYTTLPDNTTFQSSITIYEWSDYPFVCSGI
jgi:hypothetical protein